MDAACGSKAKIFPVYQKFIEKSCECVSRHYRENGNPEGFEMSGFRVALPRTMIRECPE
jgi:hypothetical protein